MIITKKKIKPNKYYNLDNYINTRYALDIAVENHFSNNLFNGDASRMIRSSTDYAFRARIGEEDSTLQNLRFPFMNYTRESVTEGNANRNWWRHDMNTVGVYVPELGTRIRYTPTVVSYDATAYFHRADEIEFAYDQLLWDDSNETVLYPTVEIEGLEVPIPSVLGYNLQFKVDFNENDFLTKERIFTMKLDFVLETSVIITNDLNISVPSKVVFDFLAAKQNIPKEDIDYTSDEGILESYTWLKEYFERS